MSSLPPFFTKINSAILDKIKNTPDITILNVFSKTLLPQDDQLRLILLAGNILVYYKDSKVLGAPIGIKFEREGRQPIYLYNRNPDIVNRWKDHLVKRINQRGFHTLFKPIKKIGKGNFASVYLAERLEDKRLVAVKAFSKEATFSQDKGKESLINQIGLLRKFDHPNVLKMYGVYESDNSIYVTVELLEGGQLFNKIQSKHKFTVQQTKTIMRGLVRGLEHLHSMRIMHRDLKPENIMIRSLGGLDIVIADFGLATWADEPQYLFVRCGTPGYVAPQIINIKDMKTKSEPVCDVFSAGLIMHILLMGRSAFPGRTYSEVLAQNRACNFSLQTDDYKQKLSPDAHDLLIRMLERNPNTRITASQAIKHPFLAADLEPQIQLFKTLSIEDKQRYSHSPLHSASQTITVTNKLSQLNTYNHGYDEIVKKSSIKCHMNSHLDQLKKFRSSEHRDKQNMRYDIISPVGSVKPALFKERRQLNS